MTVYAKELREKRAKIIKQAQELANKPDATPEDIASANASLAEEKALLSQINAIEAAAAAEASLNAKIDRRAKDTGVSTDEVREGDALKTKALLAYARHGAAMDPELHQHISGMNSKFVPTEVMAAIGIGSGGGSVLVPETTHDEITEVEKQYGPILEAANVVTTDGGNTMNFPTADDTANEGELVAENAAASEQDVAFGNVPLGAYKFSSKMVKVSAELLNDSAFDLNKWLVNALGKRLGRTISRYGTTGTGTNQPRGIVTASTLGRTGATGQTTSFTYEDLVRLEHSVDPAYRAYSSYMFHDNVLMALRLLKDDDGRPLWQPGIAVGAPDTLNGKRFVVNQAMPVPAASAKSIVFGDLKSFTVRLVNGIVIRRLVERFAENDQVAFLAWQRADSGGLDSTAIKHYAHPAS